MIVPIDTLRDGVDQAVMVTPGFAVTGTELDPLRECLVYSSPLAPRYEPATRGCRRAGQLAPVRSGVFPGRAAPPASVF